MFLQFSIIPFSGNILSLPFSLYFQIYTFPFVMVIYPWAHELSQLLIAAGSAFR